MSTPTRTTCSAATAVNEIKKYPAGTSHSVWLSLYILRPRQLDGDGVATNSSCSRVFSCKGNCCAIGKAHAVILQIQNLTIGHEHARESI
jgi:hypothetical protein